MINGFLVNRDALIAKYSEVKVDVRFLESHDALRKRCLELALFLNDLLPQGPIKKIALQCLLNAFKWANDAIVERSDDKG